MILGEKSERRDQSSFSFLENINFRKSLPRASEFEYPPLNIYLYIYFVKSYWLMKTFGLSYLVMTIKVT